MFFLDTALAPIVAAVVTVCAIPLIQRIARSFKVVAEPSPGSKGRGPTPLLGGVAIICGTLAALAAAGELPLWILGGALALLAVGTVDDARSLNPRQKLAMQVAVAVAMAFLGPPFSFTGLALPDALIEVFWLVATSNAFNLVDGIDGLASGVGIAAALAIAAVGLIYHDISLAVWSLALAGSLAGFLICNFYPASIFMGDAGALPIGLLLGMFSIQAGSIATNSRLSRFALPILVMLIPLLDTSIVTISRLATGQSISQHGHDHSHHRLQTLGLSDPRVTLVSWGAAFIACLCAVVVVLLHEPYVLMLLPWIAVGFTLIGMFFVDLTFESRAPDLAPDLPRVARMILSVAYKRPVVEIALDALILTAAYSGAYLIRFDFQINPLTTTQMIVAMPEVLGASYAAFLLMGIYRGIWRYVGLSDAMRFAAAALLACGFLELLHLLGFVSLSGSIVLLFTLPLFDLLLVSRSSFQIMRKAISLLNGSTERVLIVGAGKTGAAAAEQLLSGFGRSRQLGGFVDDDSFKWGKLIAGHPVFGSLRDLESVHQRTHFTQILIATVLAERPLTGIEEFALKSKIDLQQFSIAINLITPLVRTPRAVEQKRPEPKPVMVNGPPPEPSKRDRSEPAQSPQPRKLPG